ncbi:MAG: glycosyltransferase family 4 protein, partial [Candidatus Omnitrophica bacterium]|nr:glycosyltransferase family 4 protein [Candidatus Omnitrophota bacterium]
LIQAFVSLVKNDGSFSHQLVIVGQKLWLYNPIFDEVRKSGCEDRIIFTDYLQEEDLVLLYNFADVFVYPSLYEGFGLPVLEAMACGCPVVTSNTSSLPEVVGNAGILVNPFEIEEIAQAVLALLSNQELRVKLKNEGLRQARLFSCRKMAEKILEVYRELSQYGQ